MHRLVHIVPEDLQLSTAGCHLLWNNHTCGRHFISLSMLLASLQAFGVPLLHDILLLSRCTATDGGILCPYVYIMVSNCVITTKWMLSMKHKLQSWVDGRNLSSQHFLHLLHFSFFFHSAPVKQIFNSGLLFNWYLFRSNFLDKMWFLYTLAFKIHKEW